MRAPTIRMSFTAVAFASVAAVLTGAPAYADAFTVNVTPTTHIPAAGGDVTVTLSGLPTGDGVYVVQCAATSVTPRPSTAVNCSSANQRWLTPDLPMWSYGGEDISVPLIFHTLPTFKVAGTTFDCRVTTCGIFVRRDHMGSSDFTLDTLVPLTFLTAVPTDIVRFASGSAGLSWAARNAITSHLATYTGADAVTVTVSVAKKRGMRTLRAQHLASARAGAIRDFLIARGVSASDITVVPTVVRQGRVSRAVVTTTTYPAP